MKRTINKRKTKSSKEKDTFFDISFEISSDLAFGMASFDDDENREDPIVPEYEILD